MKDKIRKHIHKFETVYTFIIVYLIFCFFDINYAEEISERLILAVILVYINNIRYSIEKADSQKWFSF